MANEAGLVLHGYWRSSAAYRVRIALGLKGLAWEDRAVHLARGEQAGEAWRAINPQGLVPALEHPGGTITQSLAILEWLEETHPEPPLLPSDPAGRARVRSLAQLVASDIHPLNNLRVLRYLADPLGHDPEAVGAWYRHWVAEGFTALEARLAGEAATGRCCHGDTPTLADCCLVPQAYNAERFDCDLEAWPRLAAITAHCRGLPAFRAAAPEVQPDAPAD